MNLDLIVTPLFAAGQLRIGVLFLRWAQRQRVRRGAALAALICFEFLVAAGYASGSSPLAAYVPWRGASVFGAIIYLYLALSTCFVGVEMIVEALGKHLGADTNHSRRRALALAGNTLMAAPLAAIGYGALIERTNFEVRELELPLPELPGDLHGLRILQLSDIHLGVFLSERELARMIDAACSLRPHVAFATGDFISTFGDPLEACLRQLARVKADAGMLGCLGNHERYAQAEDEATRLAARTGIRLLRSEACRLRFGNSVLNVAGVDYQPSRDRENYLRGTEQLIAPGACNLLLSHNPDVFPVAARQGYNLVLAGHTHGGQVNVEVLDQSINPARFLTEYVQGAYRIGTAAEYVTRGIGTVGIPARVGAPPEITLIRLQKA
ncbi:MAG: metallophosphoesterase [Acidobacteriia bacterium]|nr:metallophosphoesterase [Terriglobia bacterium]